MSVLSAVLPVLHLNGYKINNPTVLARIPKPPMEDVLKSAIGIPTEGYLHQLHFYYPIEGGFEAMVETWVSTPEELTQ